MVWPFAVIVLVGIAGAIYSGEMLYLYEAAASNKTPEFAFPTEGEMVFVRLFLGVIFIISGVTTIGAVILGIRYAIHREKDKRYDKCVAIAYILIFVSIVGVAVLLLAGLLVGLCSSENKRKNL